MSQGDKIALLLAFFRDFVHNPAPAGMEQLSSVVGRVGDFLEEIKHLEGNVLISTHAIAMKGALEYLTPDSGGSYWSKYIGNCAVYAVENKGGIFGIPVEVLLVQTEFAGMEAGPDTYVSLKNSINASKRGNYVFHYNAPVLIVTANKNGYGNAVADSACALENMMIAANALDLGSCWINQLHWLTEHKAVLEYMAQIGLKEDETITGGLILGYPADGLPVRGGLERTGNPVTWV